MVRRERYMLGTENEATIKCVDRRMWVRTEDAEGQIQGKRDCNGRVCLLICRAEHGKVSHRADRSAG